MGSCGSTSTTKRQNQKQQNLNDQGDTEKKSTGELPAVQKESVQQPQSQHQVSTVQKKNQDSPPERLATNNVVLVEKKDSIEQIPPTTQIKISIIYGKQIEIIEGINEDQTVAAFKNDIVGQFQSSIKKSQKISNNDDFFLYHNDQCLQSNNKLSDYNLNNKEVKLFGLITVKIIKKTDKKISWGKKTFLSQTWSTLKEKMATELQIEQSKIQLFYKGSSVDDSKQLHESNVVDQDEVILTTE